MNNKKIMTIGILSKNYAAQRLFLNKLPEAKYKDIRFLNSCLWRNMHLLILRVFGNLRMSPEAIAAKLFYNFKSILPTSCSLFHFFNCINLDEKTPWVVSVESAVPWSMNVSKCVESIECDFSLIKNDEYVRKRLEALSKPNCLGLLTLSKCSERIQKKLLTQFPEYEDKINKKLTTIQPPQELIINQIGEKGLSWQEEETFTFIYVGSNFFRKGGREMLNVLSELHEKYSFRLVLISSMAVDERKYLLTSHDEDDAKRIIKNGKDWIDFYDGLPNNEVLERMKHAHVCLLPTWMDTYAYSVLESQACGTPVVSTSIRALTEINNNSLGWLIEVPVNSLNNPLLQTTSQRKTFHSILSKGLKEKCEYVLTHREEVKLKSEKCLRHIKKEHNPINYSILLRRVYKGEIENIMKMYH